MSVLLMATLLVAAPDAAATFASSQEAAESISKESQTGTLIFCKGDCLCVKVFGGGPYTHVAAIVKTGNETTVYDSMNGFGVRKQDLKSFLEAQNPDVIHVAQPRLPLTDDECKAFTEHLESELGRPYAVAHHLTGKRVEGLHCAEYVTDSLIACNLVHANNPARVSPASLAAGIVGDELYLSPTTIAFEHPAPEVEQGRNWCHQLWIDTKLCTSNCCAKMRRVFLCR